MKNRIVYMLMALVLCMGAFFLPVTAYAAGSEEDTTPPTLSASLDGETLHVEATDDLSGVQAIYMDGTRINTLTNGKADVLLKDYAGSGRQVSVYAVDCVGNRSVAVTIDNPHYVAPAPLPVASAPATPAPTPAPTAPIPAAPPATSAPTATEPEESSEPPSVSAIPEGDNVFTPDGMGTAMDTATSADGKLFYTVTTPAGNVFYLVIDTQRTDGNNVYFLNAVTESDLAALAQADGGAISSESSIPEPAPQPEPELEVEPEPQPQQDGGTGSIILIVLAALAVGGAGYYFKILKPRRQAQLDESEDDYEGDETNEGEQDEDAEPIEDGDEEDADSELPEAFGDWTDKDAAEAYQRSDGRE